MQKRNQRVWVRYVVVPGWTDSDEDVHLLGQFIQDMKNIEKVELLPYHRLGAHKWEAMGEKYELEDVKPRQKNLLSI
ncbi:Pyruvate formate-lyase 1-activating enzyme [Avibacterium paragallinarum]|uniref:Pyruvate formate-lyase 1-activating enzyme n=1 Tax=Avibacterium paragallinarum TaxID=728 RepID=A0A380X6Q3_AVIPA|nr:Pyruvate formate-lyase 1-activating enzyme [Avibacterium paragallinarum]